MRRGRLWILIGLGLGLSTAIALALLIPRATPTSPTQLPTSVAWETGPFSLPVALEVPQGLNFFGADVYHIAEEMSGRGWQVVVALDSGGRCLTDDCSLSFVDFKVPTTRSDHFLVLTVNWQAPWGYELCLGKTDGFFGAKNEREVAERLGLDVPKGKTEELIFDPHLKRRLAVSWWPVSQEEFEKLREIGIRPSLQLAVRWGCEEEAD